MVPSLPPINTSSTSSLENYVTPTSNISGKSAGIHAPVINFASGQANLAASASADGVDWKFYLTVGLALVGIYLARKHT